MDDVKLSKNFSLKEFDYVMPDKRLLFALQLIRDSAKSPMLITDGPRTVEKHIATYQHLSDTQKIDTLENKLGSRPLVEVIPWKSRHLPVFSTPCLRAVDFKIFAKESKDNYLTGKEVHVIIEDVFNSTRYVKECGAQFFGVGVGLYYCHLDIDRQRNAVWGYRY